MSASGDREQARDHAWPDRAIAEFAARHATNIDHRTLRALGVPRSSINAALRRSRLHWVHHGVYSLVPPGARPPLAPEHAALLACGEGAVLSHETAWWLHGLTDARPQGPVVLTVVGGERGRRRPQLRVHRARALDPADRSRCGRLPVTSIPRTVIDLAAGSSEPLAERLVARALHRTSRAKLGDALARHPGRRGTRGVRRVLDAGTSADTWSRAESRLFTLLREGGLPLPEANVPVGPYRPDLLWREYKVIVEYDSDEFHSSEGSHLDGANRHNDLTSWGYRVLHVTRPQLSLHPTEVVVWVVSALTRNGWYGRR